MMKTLTWKFCAAQNKLAPLVILTTIEETLEHLKKPVPMHSYATKWATCSIPLMDFMDELEEDGFVYNTQAMRAFEAAHGLEQFEDNGSQLSLLVYNCQCYRRARRLEVDGWEVVTPELLETAMREKKRVLVKGENAIGGHVQEGLSVRIWNKTGKPAAFRPRKQLPVKIGGMPAKLVA